MPQFETVKAWIQVDGVPLEEFKVEVDEDKRSVQCYVASETGKEFRVYWSWERDCVTKGELTVDGRKRSRYVQSARGRQRCNIDTMTVPEEPTLRAKLMFGDIQTTDDEASSLQDEHLVKALGCIEMEVQTGEKRLAESSPAPLQKAASNTPICLPDQQPIYERFKKAGCHRVVLGELVPATAQVVYFDKDDSEPIRFVFFYRSRDILIAQGIMPPPERAPTPPEIERTTHNADHTSVKEEEADDADDDNEDDERLRALQEQAAAIAQAIKERKAKRKVERGDGRAKKRVKVEAIDAKKAFRRGEVIDLCDD